MELSPDELQHVERIKAAILDRIENPMRNHGSFVTYMSVKQYGNAAFSADSTLATVFCDLVQWRERQRS